jgi:hypothetical protein
MVDIIKNDVEDNNEEISNIAFKSLEILSSRDLEKTPEENSLMFSSFIKKKCSS